EHPATIHLRFKMFVVEVGCDANPIFAESHHKALPKILFARFSEKHPDCGDHEENSEEVQNKMKTRHQRDAEHDHYSSHDERAENSPDQRAMLCNGGHAKVSENQNKNENVVHAERVLDDV